MLLTDKVIDNIDRYGLIEKGDNVLVGVSGGHDSLTLIHILRHLAVKRGYKLYIAHINHGVRGEESDRDERYVKNLARKMNIEFFSKKFDMEGYARDNKLSSEEAGREIRYSYFKEITDQMSGPTRIAVAHNENDQAETILMRIMRGTGLDGLSGMDFKNGNIIRPLLNISRTEIEKYCEENSIDPQIDRTNYENIYARNKVRLELIPYIEANFNPNIIKSLNRMSGIARRESEYLSKVSIEAYEEVLLSKGAKIIELDNRKLNALDEAIKYRVFRHSIGQIKGNIEGISEKNINDMVKLSDKSETGKSLDIAENLILKLNYNKLSLEISEKSDNIMYNYIVNFERPTYISELGYSVIANLKRSEDIDIGDSNRWKKYFDYKREYGDIVIRNRAQGDRVQLLGMSGRKKLKDFFIDEKIPKDRRNSIPLIEINGDIAWIVGYRIGEKFKVKPSSEYVLELEFKREKIQGEDSYEE